MEATALMGRNADLEDRTPGGESQQRRECRARAVERPRLISGRAVVISLKTFASAMLALHFSLATGVGRPLWALITVYIISHPLSGSLRLKGQLRLSATVVGIAAGLFIVGVLASSPVALTAALVGWACIWTYLAALSRTPFNYFFGLTGVTPFLLALPGAVDPAAAFAVAVVRLQAVGLGIVVVFVVDALFVPISVASTLRRDVGRWLNRAEEWMVDALSPDPELRRSSAESRAQLAVDVAELEILAAQMESEGGGKAWPATRTMAALRERVLLLLPALSAIQEAAGDLTFGDGRLPPEFRRFRQEFREWVLSGAPAERAEAVVGSLPGPGALLQSGASAWNALRARELSTRLEELVGLWCECRAWQRHLEDPGKIPPAAAGAEAPAKRPALHRDHGRALRTALAAGSSFLAVEAFWIITGTPFGGLPAMLALVLVLITSEMDQPGKAFVVIIGLLVCAAAFNGVYMYAVLPRVHTFQTFALALAVPLLPAGLLLNHSRLGVVTLLLVIFLSFGNGTLGGFDTFANSTVACIGGLAIASVVIAVIQSTTPDKAVLRILRTGWTDLSRLARRCRPSDGRVFPSRMLDRFAQVAPRLKTVTDPSLASTDLLADLRAGLHLTALREHRSRLDRDILGLVDDVLDGVSAHYATLSSWCGGTASPPAALLDRIDLALERLLTGVGPPTPGDGNDAVAMALAGIRRRLYPQAGPFSGSGGNSPREVPT